MARDKERVFYSDPAGEKTNGTPVWPRLTKKARVARGLVEVLLEFVH